MKRVFGSGIILAGLILLGLMAPGASQAACNCGSTDSGSVCTGTTTGDYSVGSTTFRWDFTCDGGACQCGQFLNGEYWVAPKTASGADAQTVEVNAAHVSGESHVGGIEINTDGSVSGYEQSMLPGQPRYNTSRDRRSDLPLSINPSSGTQSLITASLSNSQCSWTGSSFSKCIQRASVLTVVDDVPAKNGSESFRPPWAGDYKPQYSWAQVRTDILPRHRVLSENPTPGGSDLSSIRNKFAGALYDKCVAMRLYRMCQLEGETDGSSFGLKTIGAILTLSNGASLAEKRSALINYLQHGIDRYGLWKSGHEFHAESGQSGGRFPPLAFAATLIDDPTLKADVADIGYRGETMEDSGGAQPWYRGHTEFDYFGHVKISTRTSAPGSPFLLSPGGVLATRTKRSNEMGSNCYSADDYWKQKSQQVGNKDCGDWYGYIDGSSRSLPGSYFQCCWGNAIVGFVGAMHLFPQMRVQVNYEPFVVFADRMKGTLPGSSFKGTWSHGPCAASGGGSSDCNKTSSNTSPDARFSSSKHGRAIGGGGVVAPFGKPGDTSSGESVADPLWDAIRGCHANQSSPSCRDYVAPSCGDAVCDWRGIYGDAESQASCPADCVGEVAAVCGNGVREPGEVCDGSDLAQSGMSCRDIGFSSGVLGCASDCRSYDYGSCQGTVPPDVF